MSSEQTSFKPESPNHLLRFLQSKAGKWTLRFGIATAIILEACSSSYEQDDSVLGNVRCATQSGYLPETAEDFEEQLAQMFLPVYVFDSSEPKSPDKFDIIFQVSQIPDDPAWYLIFSLVTTDDPGVETVGINLGDIADTLDSVGLDQAGEALGIKHKPALLYLSNITMKAVDQTYGKIDAHRGEALNGKIRVYQALDENNNPEWKLDYIELETHSSKKRNYAGKVYCNETQPIVGVSGGKREQGVSGKEFAKRLGNGEVEGIPVLSSFYTDLWNPQRQGNQAIVVRFSVDETKNIGEIYDQKNPFLLNEHLNEIAGGENPWWFWDFCARQEPGEKKGDGCGGTYPKWIKNTPP